MAIEDDAIHDLYLLRSHDIIGNILDSGLFKGELELNGPGCNIE